MISGKYFNLFYEKTSTKTMIQKMLSPLGLLLCAISFNAKCYETDSKVTNGDRTIVLSAKILSGRLDGSGAQNGDANTSQFSFFEAPRRPRFAGIQVINGGQSLLVADSSNHVIRIIDAIGVSKIFAGSFSRAAHMDGKPDMARFITPSGICQDRRGNIFISDSVDNTIRKISPNGGVATIAGISLTSGHQDGAAKFATFSSPQGLAVDDNGNLFIADTLNHAIRKISPYGVVTTIAGKFNVVGGQDGALNVSSFSSPTGIAIDKKGNVFISDASGNTIRKIDNDGITSTVAGLYGVSGSADGIGTKAHFDNPLGIVVAKSGALIVADANNHAFRRIDGGSVTTFAGSRSGESGSLNESLLGSRFRYPVSITNGVADEFYILDGGNAAVRKIVGQKAVMTVAGSIRKSGLDVESSDGSSDTSSFAFQGDALTWAAIAADRNDGVIVAEPFTHTIRRIDFNGLVSTIAGKRFERGITDGSGADARFAFPAGLAIDRNKNIYIADGANGVIRKLTPNGTVHTIKYGDLTSVARGKNKQFPNAIASTTTGDIYFSDAYEGTVRRIFPDDTVTVLAGRPGVNGYRNGAKEYALLNDPKAIAADGSNNIYVAEWNSIIRKISVDGSVSTLAGIKGTYSHLDGKSGNASFAGIAAVTADEESNVYVIDSVGGRLRKITPDGNVSTIQFSDAARHSIGMESDEEIDHPAALVSIGQRKLLVTISNMIVELTLSR